ncbi:hypothetical protein [Emticicia soli]|uniref:Uncharacterized protein n=1 Tax=Emticicia soli TaxID=2027878 RepID=A0ABW5J6B1_9BACT
MTNKFMRYARAAFLPMMMLGAASCDTKGDPNPVEPGTGPGTNPVTKVGELVKVPIQYVDIQDSLMTISNYGSVDAIVMQISLKKSDIGKGIPVKYKYTGMSSDAAIKKTNLMSDGSIELTTASETAFDLALGKSDSQNPLLKNDSFSYKNLGIEKVYTNKITVENETDVSKGIEKAKTFMQTGKEIEGTLLKVTGKGVPNQIIINKIPYNIN